MSKNPTPRRKVALTGALAMAIALPLVLTAVASPASAAAGGPACQSKNLWSHSLTLEKRASDSAQPLAGAVFEVTAHFADLATGAAAYSSNPFYAEEQAATAALGGIRDQRDAALRLVAPAADALTAAETVLADAQFEYDFDPALKVAVTELADAEAALAALTADDPGYADAQAKVDAAQRDVDALEAPHLAAIADAQAAVDAAQAAYDTARADSDAASAAYSTALDALWQLRHRADWEGTLATRTVATGTDGTVSVQLLDGSQESGSCELVPASYVEVQAPEGYILDDTVRTEDFSDYVQGGANATAGHTDVVLNDPVPAPVPMAAPAVVPADPDPAPAASPVARAAAAPLAVTGGEPAPPVAGVAAVAAAVAGGLLMTVRRFIRRSA